MIPSNADVRRANLYKQNAIANQVEQGFKRWRKRQEKEITNHQHAQIEKSEWKRAESQWAPWLFNKRPSAIQNETLDGVDVTSDCVRKVSR